MQDRQDPTPAEANVAITEEVKNRRARQLEVLFWLLAITLGFVHVWADRHYLTNSDAMSYLDLAEAYLRHDWRTALSAYWSPLYPFLIALALWIAKPSSYWKFSVLHLVNFAIYLFALGCFGFLIRELIRLHRSLRAKLILDQFAVMPDWTLVALGYPLFIWSTLYLIVVTEESPDLLVAAIVYLACAILLRIRRHPSSWSLFVILGITLGIGYLAKSIMLPMAIIFLAAGLFSIGSLRRAAPRVLLAAVTMMLIAAPFVLAISSAKGRLTLGDSGNLNYLWSINRVPVFHWQGDKGGNGHPRHPTRKILDTPPVYEFGEPIAGTYPPWFDPTYWYEGSVSKFDLRQQLRVLLAAVKNYYDLFYKWGLQYGLLVGLLTLYMMSRRGWLMLHDLTYHWSLIIPALAGIGLYSLVNVQGRYVASFFVLLWLDLFSAVRLPASVESQRLIRATTLVLMGAMVFTSVASSGREATQTVQFLIGSEDRTEHEHWQVAEELRELGLVPGDRVAVIGKSSRAFWAHLAALRINAEIQREDAAGFWESDSSVRDQAIQAIARTEVKNIVAEQPPSGVDLSGWHRIRNTGYYIYILKAGTNRASSKTVKLTVRFNS